MSGGHHDLVKEVKVEQINLFEILHKPFKIHKKIRLIEKFGGYGSQAMALEYMGIDFEHYKLCEWEVNAIASYKKTHMENDSTDYSTDMSKEELADTLFKMGISNDGKKPMKLKAISRKGEQWLRRTYNNIRATHNLVDITKIHADDLEIVERDKYCYIMTYSFPCQDLSKAGKQKGMAKGSNTRSGMLWEIERIIGELWVKGQLPDVLLMENVPDVIGNKNINDFMQWYASLEACGYQSYYKILNAKDYGIPQNRNRCFMVSILGDYNYEFPKTIPLKLRLKDILETSVDEKYYISNDSNDRVKNINLKNSVKHGTMIDFSQSKREGNVRTYEEISCTLTSRDCHDPRCVVIGETDFGSNESMNRIYSIGGISPTINTMQGGNLQPKIVEPVCLNPKVDGKQPSLQDRVYDSNSIATAVTTSFMPNIAVDVDDSVMITDVYNKNTKKTDIIGTITSNGNASLSNCGTFLVHEQNKRFYQQAAETLEENNCDEGDIINAFNKTVDKSGLCPTLTTRPEGFKTAILPVVDKCRIRKLTPRECGRLMGVSDDDITKMECVNSNSQLYKQFGNSIVVNVLMAIFSEMIPADYEYMKKTQRGLRIDTNT